MHLKSQWKLFCSNEVLHFEKQKSWETKGKKRFEPFEMFRRLVRAWQHRLLTTGNCRCCTLQVRYGGFCILLTIARLRRCSTKLWMLHGMAAPHKFSIKQGQNFPTVLRRLSSKKSFNSHQWSTFSFVFLDHHKTYQFHLIWHPCYLHHCQKVATRDECTANWWAFPGQYQRYHTFQMVL